MEILQLRKYRNRSVVYAYVPSGLVADKYLLILHVLRNRDNRKPSGTNTQRFCYLSLQ